MTGGDKGVLRRAGMMGHTVVLVVDDAASGRRLAAECDDVEFAALLAARKYAKLAPAVYRKRGRSWQKVKE